MSFISTTARVAFWIFFGFLAFQILLVVWPRRVILAAKWVGNGGLREDEESFLDRLEIVSGQDVSKSGVTTLEATYRWIEGIRRANDALLFVAERDVYEEYNFGLRLVFRRK